MGWKRKVGRAVVDAYAGPLGTLLYDNILTEPSSKRVMAPDRVYGQGTWTHERRKYGRRVSRRTTKYARLLAQASLRKSVFGLDNWSDFYTAGGQVQLNNYWDSNSPHYYCPLHLYDVTAAPNNVAGTVQTAQCGYRLGFTNTTSGLEWKTLGPALQIINTPFAVSSTQGVPNNASLLRAVKVKLMFYAPTTIPVRVRVALVQLREQRYHPSKSSAGDLQGDKGIYQADNTTLPVGMGSSTTSAAAFWQNVVHSYCKNPVAIGNGNLVQRYMKVLRSTSFTLVPKETTDSAATTYHQVDWYQMFQRKCTYNWEDSSLLQMDAAGSVAIDVAANKCCVEPDARIYLMIVADSKYATASGPPGPAAETRPSYDICLRTYHDDV